jgi:hypothetical protein
MQTLAESDEHVEQQESIDDSPSRLPKSTLIASGVCCLLAILLVVSIGYNYQQSRMIKAKAATVAKLKKDMGEKDARIERLEVDRQQFLSRGEPMPPPDQDSATIDDIIAAAERSASERENVQTIAPSLDASKGSTTAIANKSADHPSPNIVNGECKLTTNAINKDPNIIIGCIQMMNDNDPLVPQQRGKTISSVVPG